MSERINQFAYAARVGDGSPKAMFAVEFRRLKDFAEGKNSGDIEIDSLMSDVQDSLEVAKQYGMKNLGRYEKQLPALEAKGHLRTARMYIGIAKKDDRILGVSSVSTHVHLARRHLSRAGELGEDVTELEKELSAIVIPD